MARHVPGAGERNVVQASSTGGAGPHSRCLTRAQYAYSQPHESRGVNQARGSLHLHPALTARIPTTPRPTRESSLWQGNTRPSILASLRPAMYWRHRSTACLRVLPENPRQRGRWVSTTVQGAQQRPASASGRFPPSQLLPQNGLYPVAARTLRTGSPQVNPLARLFLGPVVLAAGAEVPGDHPAEARA